MYDIIFISYFEPNAEKNWEIVKERFPRSKRIDGVKGIHQAHKRAAKLSFTNLFWVVDADSVILDNFNFDYKVEKDFENSVHVWRSINPVNDLRYGYSAVKLLPKKKVLQIDEKTVDMTTSISNSFRVVDEISNIAEFNTDEFSTWKSAFREVVKLSSKVIERQNDEETNERLKIWCNIGRDRPYGDYCILGANSGYKFAKENPKRLGLINDFEWLKEKFKEDCNES